MTTFETARQVATTITASATLVAGKHTPVDATSGAVTATLPTGARSGAHLSVEKVDASANVVTVSGSIRGTTSTLTLTSQYHSITLIADPSGSWHPTADHRTAASLAATYETQAHAVSTYAPAARWPKYGFNFITSYTGQTPTNSTVDASIGYRLLLTGGSPVKCQLVFHAYPNSAGALQNVQLGNFNDGSSTTPDLTSVVDHAVATLLASGVTIEAIKLHTPSGYDPATYAAGASQFWTDYQTIAVALATKYQGTGIPRFAVTNEFPNGTTNGSYSTQYAALMAAVKAKGYAVGIAANHPDELARNTQIANLDWLGLNVYPSAGYKGSATTPADIVAGLERYGLFQTIADYRRIYPSKPFAVTEIGTPDTWESLGSPGTFSYSDTYTRVGGAAKNVFWQGVLDGFNKWQPDCELYAWDDGRYSPYVDSYNSNAQYPTVLATMKARTVFA